MHKLHFSIDILAPCETVYQLMLDDAGYRHWTSPFHPSSQFIGNWQSGSKMLFVAIENGQPQGMVSKIVENVPQHHVFIEHLGMLKDGQEILSGDEVKDWAGAREDYYFSAIPGGCRVDVTMDSQQQWAEFFQQSWPQALAALKRLAEAASGP